MHLAMIRARVPRLSLLKCNCRYSSSDASDSGAELTRDFIGRVLYDTDKGYFERDVIHTAPQPIEFKNLWGRWEYEMAVDKLYRRKPEGWHTPVEVFAPWYSRAIARYMLHQISACGSAGSSSLANKRDDDDSLLQVVEIGGGSGTNAVCVLDYLRAHAPAVYGHSSYTIV